ncbi:MAG TPA: UDP-2,3-diacylglucosamine diphosphatase LpxI [Candidatus Binatia bacterium]|nr:UDP-2,3-diacylglucosamine diphosphatase LpxI [Candidatus Binatia bacterium]
MSERVGKRVGERVGLIAGSGRFPTLFAETARRHGVEVFAVAHRGETDPELERVVEGLAWIYPGELDAMITALKDAGVRRTVMVGGIAKPKLFREFRPDARAMALIARLGQVRDDLVLRGVAAELEAEGIAVVESTVYLQEIVPGVGVLGARPPTAAEWRDIRFGFRAAKVIGQFDIGQSVVVRMGAVIAVEGIEGTDATIRRAGELANGDIVLVKVCKPAQDTRFDLPAVGPGTVRALAQVQGRALAIEAGRTVVLDREEMIALADRADVAVVAVDGTEGER